jgi:hypothetical protein
MTRAASSAFAKPLEAMTDLERAREEASLRNARDKTRKALLNHRRSAIGMTALIRTYDDMLLTLHAATIGKEPPR